MAALLNRHNIHYPGRRYDSSVKPDPKDRNQRGALLFEMLRIVHLTIQQRAECDVQRNIVESLQTGMFQMDYQMRTRLKQNVLTPADIQSDLGWITEAIVIVSNHAERWTVTWQRMSAWARLHKQPILRWRSKLHGPDWQNPDKWNAAHKEHIYATEIQTHEYFCRGMPGLTLLHS